MAKKKPTRDPSDCVYDTFRTKNAGVVDIQSNSKPYDDEFHVKRSTLRDEVEYRDGKFVEVKADILRNAVRSMGDVKHCSSSKPRGAQPGPQFGASVPSRRRY